MKNSSHISNHCRRHALILTFFAVFLSVGFSAKAQGQRDSLFHENILYKMKNAETTMERARLYYQDFLYANYGEYNPYFYEESYWWVHTPTFQNSADSALVLLKTLYNKKENQFMYYPICQLEHYLGIPHDPSITHPDTSDFYVPLQSGTSADLGIGWQSNYTQHLLTKAEWALSHSKTYTTFFEKTNEPSIWKKGKKNPQISLFRMTIYHLPSTRFSIYNVGMDKGKPYVSLKEGYQKYNRVFSSYTCSTIISEHRTIRLSQGKWEILLNLIEKIDSLEWVNEGQVIDGNRYFCEYAHNGHYHSHYTCEDPTTDSLHNFMYHLFKTNNTFSVYGEVCESVYEETFGNIRNRLDSVEVKVYNKFSTQCVAKTNTALFHDNIFYCELPAGHYRFVFKRQGYKKETMKNINITSDTLLNATMTREKP